MGLLVSDSMHLDLALDNAARWQDSLIDYVYATEPMPDADEYGAADPIH